MEDILAKPLVMFCDLPFMADKPLIVLWWEEEGGIINFVLLFACHARGFMEHDYSTCVNTLNSV